MRDVEDKEEGDIPENEFDLPDGVSDDIFED